MILDDINHSNQLAGSLILFNIDRYDEIVTITAKRERIIFTVSEYSSEFTGVLGEPCVLTFSIPSRWFLDDFSGRDFSGVPKLAHLD